MNATLVKSILDERKDALKTMEVENATLEKQIKQEDSGIKSASKKLVISQDSLQFVENVANSRRASMKEQIESVLSEAVVLVYGASHSVELTYDIKNNRSSVIIELIRKIKDGLVRRQMDGFGGGVSDVLSVPLRLLVLLSSRKNAPVCVLDECYKHIDVERIEVVAQFLKDISDKLGLQLIVCSHHEPMYVAADSVWYTTDDGSGKAVVKKLSKKYE